MNWIETDFADWNKISKIYKLASLGFPMLQTTFEWVLDVSATKRHSVQFGSVHIPKPLPLHADANFLQKGEN